MRLNLLDSPHGHEADFVLRNHRSSVYNATMKTLTPRPPADALDRLLDPLSECLTPAMARRIVAFRADSATQARIDELAEKCAKDGRYEFMFSLLPLVLERGTASPANPVAMF